MQIRILPFGLFLGTAIHLVACAPFKSMSSKPAAADPDVTNAVDELSEQHIRDVVTWQGFLLTAERNPDNMKPLFQTAAEEFEVPVELLMVIGQVETNWTQIGPSIDRGWGVMHLVQNNYADTLGLAAQLLNVSVDTLKQDARQNIRGAAAILQYIAGPKRFQFKGMEDWWDAVKYLTGLATPELQEQQAKLYYETLRKGVKSKTFYGKEIRITAKPKVSVTNLLTPPSAQFLATNDYPKAISNFTTCNFTSGRNVKLDTWINHYIGTGTYAGAISWFKNCRGDAGSSAHFVIRNDGEISQVVNVADTAWHAGASSSRNNNHRSIGVEHEATATHPEYWQSEAMLKASSEMARYFANKYGIPKVHISDKGSQAAGVRGHQEMPGTATDCPGAIPWEKWMKLFNDEPAPAPTPAPPAPAPTPADPPAAKAPGAPKNLKAVIQP